MAAAPDRPVDGGMPAEALIAHVVISKYCDSSPLYRPALRRRDRPDDQERTGCPGSRHGATGCGLAFLIKSK